MRHLTALLLLTLLACRPGTPAAETVPADPHGTVFVGGTVVAGATQTPRSDYAVFVSGGRIREVGPAETLRAAHPSARIVDTTGATVLPGLTDAHGHLYGVGLALDIVNLVGSTSYEEVIARVKQRADAAAPGEWITGRGWDQNDWPVKEFPTAAALDAAIPNHPVVLERVDGHATLANSAAMRAAGVTAATADPEGGKIVRDSAGNPTGVFVDAAAVLVDRAVPLATPEQRKARVLAAARAIAAAGLTEMHDAGIDAPTIKAVQELIDENRFPIRVYAMLSDNEALVNQWFANGPLVGYGGRLTVRAVKLYVDGALGSRGA
ncbi:MAG TPA: amidohydrolase family protein, partial [Thermoanaerobaculia bacterium]